MTKKILAGVLAAASVLSVSSVASATTRDDTATKTYGTGTGQANGQYSVQMNVTYGDVTAEIPDTTAFNKAFINPYGATVKTLDSTNAVVAKNNSPVASGVFAVKNLDTEEGLKVNAKTKVIKATGVVVKNASTGAPFGWNEVSPVSADGYDYLTDYDKLTLKNSEGKAVKATDGTSAIDTSKSTGGGVAAKQGKNIGMWLVGGIKATELDGAGGKKVNLVSDKYGDVAADKADWKYVAFDTKLETSGELMIIAKAAGTPASPVAEVGYFMLGGELSKMAKDNVDDAKDTVTFNVAFKLSPVAPTAS